MALSGPVRTGQEVPHGPDLLQQLALALGLPYGSAQVVDLLHGSYVLLSTYSADLVG